MIILERLRPDHFPRLRLQDNQASLQAVLTESYGADLVAQGGVAWAAVMDGEVIAAAGMFEVWSGRALGWALFSDTALANFIAIHRVARKVLADCPWRRIEIAVDRNHAAGVRWAERLGFQREGLMRAYTADGRDCFLYARVR